MFALEAMHHGFRFAAADTQGLNVLAIAAASSLTLLEKFLALHAAFLLLLRCRILRCAFDSLARAARTRRPSRPLAKAAADVKRLFPGGPEGEPHLQPLR
nr:hypothetical protein [uncultured Noviherbaspirillum sp.]